MTIFLILVGIVTVLVIGVALVLSVVRVDRALIARSEVQARQRRAEAEMQHVVQATIQHMFDAARRRP